LETIYNDPDGKCYTFSKVTASSSTGEILDDKRLKVGCYELNPGQEETHSYNLTFEECSGKACPCDPDSRSSTLFNNLYLNVSPRTTSDCSGEIGLIEACHYEYFYFNPCIVYKKPKKFGCLNVNPCFLNKAEIIIRCSDLVICEMVQRVWCAELSQSCGEVWDCRYDYSLTQSDKYQSNTYTPDHPLAKSFFVNTYLIDLDIETPALYLGKNMAGSDGFFDSSCLSVKRLCFYQNTPNHERPPHRISPLQNNSSCAGNPSCNKRQHDFRNYYALMFSKCLADPVIDPTTTLARRCSPLINEFAIVDRVRPYAGTTFAPGALAPACYFVQNQRDTKNTICDVIHTNGPQGSNDFTTGGNYVNAFSTSTHKGYYNKEQAAGPTYTFNKKATCNEDSCPSS
jgi:hypothetical protein